MLPDVGVTRVGNITGLDRIGVPVMISVRPNGKGVCTNSGKGLDPDAAWVSAAMESIERYHAENVRPVLERLSYREVARTCGVIPRDRLPCRKHCAFHADWMHDWVVGWDIVHACRVAVPCSIVSMDRPAHPYDFPIFQSNTVGLGSGSHPLEAILAGALEVVEHDAVTCHRYRLAAGGSTPRVDLRTISCPVIRRVVERLERASVTLALTDCTSDTGLPAYEACVSDDLVPQIGTYYGHAAHFDAHAAMLGAVLEAVQGRAVYIAGSRDDYHQERLAFLRGSAHRQDVNDLKQSKQPAVSHPSAATDTLEGDLTALTRHLTAVGVDQLIVIDLTRPALGVPVVKVIIPGLEGCLTDKYVPGPRALSAGALR